jgi:hypothetical protein
MSQEQTALAFPTLQGHKFINLTTFRKTGKAVVTPVWFAQENGRVYVYTGAETGKAKRIRNNPQVQLTPSTRTGEPLGPSVDAVARILSREEEPVAKRALDQKYGWQKKLFDLFLKLRKFRHIYLEITPA